MPRHLPGLDGVRAVAVLMVIAGHASRLPAFPEAMKALLVVDIDELGVTVFFVLSGFLITTLLIDERERTGRVSLRDFYARRTIRIFPAAYAYMAVVALAAHAGLVALAPGDMLHALTYTMNYHHEAAWTLGHLWSLAVEEQFYLLWPLAFVWAGRRALVVALLVLCAAPLLRVVGWVVLPFPHEGLDRQFQFVCDALATGCVLALVARQVGLQRLGAMVPGRLVVLAPVVALAAAAWKDRPSFYLPLGVTMIHVAIAACILWVVANPSARVGRALNSRVAVVIGVMSYSLYLWQQLFLDPDTFSATLATRLLLVLGAAAASFHLVEKPLMALRSRYRP